MEIPPEGIAFKFYIPKSPYMTQTTLITSAAAISIVALGVFLYKRIKNSEGIDPEPMRHVLISVGAIKRDIKDYLSERNIEKIIDEPKKAVLYSLAFKISGMFFALIFPFLGYGMFFMSVALIDRIMILRHEEFGNSLIRSIPWLNTIANLWRQITGGEVIPNVNVDDAN